MAEEPCDYRCCDRNQGREDAGLRYAEVLDGADPERECQARAKYGKTDDRVPYVSVEVNFHVKAVQTFPQKEREKVHGSDQELIHHDDLAGVIA